MKKHGSLFGGMLIIAGTTIGAGLLALPIVSAQLGFIPSLLLMIGICSLMTYTALVTIEINLYFGKGINISSAAEIVLGKTGRGLSTFAILLLYYALLSAYIAMGTSTLKEIISTYLNIQTSSIIPEILFTLILGIIVYSCTKAVDHFNRILFTIKVIFFAILIAALVPVVRSENFLYISKDLSPIWAVIALFVVSFGFHGSIPSVIDYVGLRPKKLFWTFLIGSLIPLGFYILWQGVTLGSLPLVGEHSFQNVAAQNDDVGFFISELNGMTESKILDWATNVFATLAIATSFLGVGLGLFDFFAQKGRFSNTKKGRIASALCTFVVPFVFAIYYPQGFMMALTYGGLALTIIAVIMPSLIALRLRRRADYHPSYRAPGGSWLLVLTFLIGCGIIINEVVVIVMKP